MIKSLLFLLLAFQTSSACFAQGFINDYKKTVKKQLEKHSTKTRINGVFEETDSTLAFLVRSDSFQKADFVFVFNAKNKCIAEKRTSCDSCTTKYLNESLNNTKLGWQQLNANQYVSKYSKKLLLQKEGTTAFTIRKMVWNKKTYKEIVERGRL
jgi:hypothetical protein